MNEDGNRITSIDYEHPGRPLPIKLLNGGGSLLDLAGLLPDLESETLIRAAERKTGLSDFGELDFREPMEVLLESIRREANLNPFGRLVTKGRVVGTLTNNLRARELFTRYPDILKTELRPPVVITGLQRSGTTLLHRLLAIHHDIRALASWEAINPAPFLSVNGISGDGTGGREIVIAEGEMEKRINIAESREKALAYLAPDFFAIHPVEAHSPEEDVLLLDYSFLSTVPEATLRVPSYSKWVEKQNQYPAYEHMKNLLKLLTWQRPGNRWILKSPHHLEYLDTLFEVFPGAKVIQTHRDPCTTIASFCSMICHGRGLFSDAVDPEEVGAHWSKKIKRLIERAMGARARYGEERFLDIYYNDLVQDPLGEIERVYRFLEITPSGSEYSMIEEALERNKQYRFGIHRYTLSSFGLSPEGVKEAFELYYKRFDIDLEERCEIPGMIPPARQ